MPKKLLGKVVSTKMQKTIVVAVKRERPHPLYKKKVRRTKNFKVHSEDSNIKLGDTVRIVETKPLSKDKRWKVLEVVNGTA